jgi:hypothetical protein
VNNIIGLFGGTPIPEINVEKVEVCFVGVGLTVSILGFEVDLAILLGLPMIAFLFRWVMRS